MQREWTQTRTGLPVLRHAPMSSSYRNVKRRLHFAYTYLRSSSSSSSPSLSFSSSYSFLFFSSHSVLSRPKVRHEYYREGRRHTHTLFAPSLFSLHPSCITKRAWRRSNYTAKTRPKETRGRERRAAGKKAGAREIGNSERNSKANGTKGWLTECLA